MCADRLHQAPRSGTRDPRRLRQSTRGSDFSISVAGVAAVAIHAGSTSRSVHGAAGGCDSIRVEEAWRLDCSKALLPGGRHPWMVLASFSL